MASWCETGSNFDPHAVPHTMQQNIDMHAGHETAPEPAKDQPGEQIDWDAHKRFMRGL